MTALYIIGGILGGLFGYALIAGIATALWYAVLPERSYGAAFDQQHGDPEFLGWAWVISIPVGIFYLVVWRWFMRPLAMWTGKVHQLPMYVYRHAFKLPALLASLPAKLRKPTKIPEARIHNK